MSKDTNNDPTSNNLMTEEFANLVIKYAQLKIAQNAADANLVLNRLVSDHLDNCVALILKVEPDPTIAWLLAQSFSTEAINTNRYHFSILVSNAIHATLVQFEAQEQDATPTVNPEDLKVYMTGNDSNN